MPKIRNEGGPFFAAWGPLTKTSAFDFTYGRYDERKGVIAAYDYCSYNR
jgi:hypothetical protein